MHSCNTSLCVLSSLLGAVLSCVSWFSYFPGKASVDLKISMLYLCWYPSSSGVVILMLVPPKRNSCVKPDLWKKQLWRIALVQLLFHTITCSCSTIELWWKMGKLLFNYFMLSLYIYFFMSLSWLSQSFLSTRKQYNQNTENS